MSQNVSTGIITSTGTCIIHQNEAGPLWIISLLLNIVTISLNSNVSLSGKILMTGVSIKEMIKLSTQKRQLSPVS